MEVNEVFDGIAKAIDAAKPAQEYCFLWISHWSTCMTKNEWSGWMQAIGVVFTLSIPVAGRLLTKYKAKPVVNDVYRQALRHSIRAKRLDALLSNALGNPANLIRSHQEAKSIVRSLRDFTDMELESLRLYSAVAASRLRTCGELQAKIVSVLDLPVSQANQHFSVQLILEEAYKYSREFRDKSVEAVQFMSDAGLKVRSSLDAQET